MKFGDVYWVNFEPSSPPEFGKVRPAIIFSANEFNQHLKTVVVLPLSSKPPEIWPLRVEVKLEKKKKSYAVITGLRHVSKDRLFKHIDSISFEDSKRLKEAVLLYLAE